MKSAFPSTVPAVRMRTAAANIPHALALSVVCTSAACASAPPPTVPNTNHNTITAPADAAPHPAVTATPCRQRGQLALQVLGSGGPIADDARASSGYLLWHRGKARLLIDAGGGVFLRFGEVGAKLEDLDAIAITHLHVDHVVDLAALLKSGYFAHRSRPLPLFGPDGNQRFPAMGVFVNTLLNPTTGAFGYLSGYLDGSLFPLPVTTLAAQSQTSKQIFSNNTMVIRAVGVNHGSIPAIGYVVAIDNKRIAFAGDQNNHNTPFLEMAKDADVLIMHHAIAEHGAAGITHLHAIPSDIGRAAKITHAKMLVLSHHMQRALRQRDQSLNAIRQHYRGPVYFANDLSCYVLQPSMP